MQSVSCKQELLLKLRCPSRFDKAQVELLIGAVDLVADNWMSNRRQMHPNLMRSSRPRNGANEREFLPGCGVAPEAVLDAEFGDRGRALRMNGLLEVNR